jgi:hypothetical protein
MRFDVDKKQGKFILFVDGTNVFEADKLSSIVLKIEAYLKLRYLPEPEKQKAGFLDRISGVINGR